jgi:4-hydroxy-tetrahydrodipicolinate synthase
MPSADRDPVFRGTGVALLTIFDGTGGLDAAASAQLAQRLGAEGVEGVVVAGTTGEAAFLSTDERRRLLAAVREAVPAEVAVVAGTGAATATEAAGLTRAAVEDGADAVLALSPRGEPDCRGYYDAVAEAASGLPVLAYHFPAVSSPGVSLELLPELPVAGLKDSSGDAERLRAEAAAVPEGLYVGSALLLDLARRLGCAGSILAAANIEPSLCRAALAGDESAQERLSALEREIGSDLPRRLKQLVAERWHFSSVTRANRS